jgi:hypothetical protein
MIKKCWFDADGNLINIGEWDTQLEQVEVEPEKYDEQGNKIADAVYYTVERNPLPEGAYCEEREVIQTEDGGLALAEDYAALRRAAYPPYSLWDVIDEILKHITPEPGSALEQIQAQRLAVKAQYPKPEGSAE